MSLAFDFFAGTGSATKALSDRGWDVVKVEMDSSFEPDIAADILSLESNSLLKEYGQPDFIWASPPCTAFSVASIGYHWGGGFRAYEPKTKTASDSLVLVKHTRNLINNLAPKQGFIIENPRGVLRKMQVMADLPRSTVTYCQYGDSRMKPTDLWGGIDGWLPSRRCSNGDACHEPAPRGSRSGTQGLKNAKVRSIIPYGLSSEVADRLESVMR